MITALAFRGRVAQAGLDWITAIRAAVPRAVRDAAPSSCAVDETRSGEITTPEFHGRAARGLQRTALGPWGNGPASARICEDTEAALRKLADPDRPRQRPSRARHRLLSAGVVSKTAYKLAQAVRPSPLPKTASFRTQLAASADAAGSTAFCHRTRAKTKHWRPTRWSEPTKSASPGSSAPFAPKTVDLHNAPINIGVSLVVRARVRAHPCLLCMRALPM